MAQATQESVQNEHIHILTPATGLYRQLSACVERTPVEDLLSAPSIPNQRHTLKNTNIQEKGPRRSPLLVPLVSSAQRAALRQARIRQHVELCSRGVSIYIKGAALPLPAGAGGAHLERCFTRPAAEPVARRSDGPVDIRSRKPLSNIQSLWEMLK